MSKITEDSTAALTIRQQLTKDFMVAIVAGINTNVEIRMAYQKAANENSVYFDNFVAQCATSFTDAYINEINK